MSVTFLIDEDSIFFKEQFFVDGEDQLSRRRIVHDAEHEPHIWVKAEINTNIFAVTNGTELHVIAV